MTSHTQILQTVPVSELTTPLHHYKFQDDVTDSQGSKNGTATDITFADGKMGRGAVFNGTSGYIDVPAEIDFSAKTEQTIACWIKLSNINKTQYIMTHEKTNQTPFAQYRFYINSSNQLEYHVRYSGDNNETIVGTTDLSADIWYYIVATKNSSGVMKVWVNGIEDGSANNTAGFNTPHADFTTQIGAANTGTIGAFFDGTMDELKIYDSALNQTQIRESMFEGLTIKDFESGSVNKNIGDNYSSSQFDLVFSNYAGRNKDTFDSGDEIQILLEKNVFPPTKKIITGIIENINTFGPKNEEKIQITGRDYTSVLQNTTVPPEIYANQEVSVIAKDLMTKYAPTITTNNVQVTTKTINHITFNHTSLFDALRKLAEESEHFFYIDVDKDLHLEPKGSTSSGVVADGTNIIDANFNKNIDDVRNDIWVYGDRYLVAAPTLTFTADGTGSVFSTTYKPRNTDVQVNGSIQLGGVAEMTSVPTTGTEYLVDFHNKEIIFVSGTNTGNHIPISGDSITINYHRDRPIIKRASDDTSQVRTKGARSEVIVDKAIKDPRMARDIAKRVLTEGKTPRFEGTVVLKDIVDLTPGNTILVNLPTYNINNVDYRMVSVKYSLDKLSLTSDEVLTVKINERIKDFADVIKDVIVKVKELQAGDIDTADGLSRLVFTPGSMGFRVNDYTVRTNNMLDSFTLGHPERGVLGKRNDLGAGSINNNQIVWTSAGSHATGDLGSYALLFPGSHTGYDGINIANNAGSWDGTLSGLSVDFWFTGANADAPNAYWAVIDHEAHQNSGWNIIMNNGDTTAEKRLQFRISNPALGSTEAITTDNFPATGLNHFAIKLDTGSVNIYRNGSVIKTGNFSTGSILQNSGVLSIGNEGGRYLDGAINKLRIWKRPITSAEIGSTIDSPHTIGSNGLEGNYLMWEGTGSLIYNSVPPIQTFLGNRSLGLTFNQSGGQA